MAILVDGGDSVNAITQRARAGGHGCLEQWSERKTRDLTKAIPIDTEAMELVNHYRPGGARIFLRTAAGERKG